MKNTSPDWTVNMVSSSAYMLGSRVFRNLFLQCAEALNFLAEILRVHCGRGSVTCGVRLGLSGKLASNVITALLHCSSTS